MIVRERARGTFEADQVRPAAPVELHGFLDDVMVLGEMGETLSVDRDEVVAPSSVAEHVSRVRRQGFE